MVHPPSHMITRLILPKKNLLDEVIHMADRDDERALTSRRTCQPTQPFDLDLASSSRSGISQGGTARQPSDRANWSGLGAETTLLIRNSVAH
jgi:hypothetical protein